MKLDGLIKDILALNRVARTGNRQRIRLVWKAKPDAVRTLAGVAQRTERKTGVKPTVERPPTRRVQSILDQLVNRAEKK